MNLKGVVLVAALGISLSGCSVGTATEDLATCEEARVLTLNSATSVMFIDNPSYEEVVSKNDFFANRLRDLASRVIASELSDALNTDADLSDVAQEFSFGINNTLSFCNEAFKDNPNW